MSKHKDKSMPWRVSSYNSDYVEDNNGELVAVVWGSQFEIKARLIAAAPELLEALENIMGWIPAEPVECNGNKCRELYCVSCFGEDTAKETLEGLKVKVVIAKQAIAKAKGEAND